MRSPVFCVSLTFDLATAFRPKDVRQLLVEGTIKLIGDSKVSQHRMQSDQADFGITLKNSCWRHYLIEFATLILKLQGRFPLRGLFAMVARLSTFANG